MFRHQAQRLAVGAKVASLQGLVQQTLVALQHTMQCRAMARALVLAEQTGGKVSSSAARVVTAAREMTDDAEVDVLVAGAREDVEQAAQQLRNIDGVHRVRTACAERFREPLAEPLAALLRDLAAPDAGEYSHCVTAASDVGRSALPRAAALLGASPVTDVVRVLRDRAAFERPAFAGDILTVVRPAPGTTPILATVRPTAFEPSGGRAEAAAVEAVAEDVVRRAAETPGAAFVARCAPTSGRPDLGCASVVVAAGRGLKNAEGVKLAQELADALGGALGASRAIVDAGLATNDLQVGQTGKVVAPDLYIAAGISGAIQHVAGMRASRVIVAINTDADAPITGIADYTLAEDAATAVPKLTALLRARKKS
ncbi:unnamed protein product [Pedinophyceae sp. YPF-701]|nr:unnamed protein product [Pedinophyceae sp. YPF-701]